MTDQQQENIWQPEGVIPGFQAFMERFYTACSPLAYNLMRCLAVSLDLPEKEALVDAHSDDEFHMKLLHYPSVPLRELQDATSRRIGAHADLGSLTMLFQDSAGGLEVQDLTQKGVFMPATPIDGTVVVNIGDILERWSNGRWKSTVHRVVEPPAIIGEFEKSGNEDLMCPQRYSVALFTKPNLDVVIDTLAGTWDENTPKQYEKITTAEFIQMRMSEVVAPSNIQLESVAAA